MAGVGGPGIGSFSFGRKTAGGGTAFTLLVPPKKNHKAKVMSLGLTCGATAHTLYALRELAHTTVVAAVAASATTFKIARDPGNYSANYAADGRNVPSTANNLIAASDYYAVRLPDDTILVDTISAVTTNGDGTVTVTPNATIAAGGIKAGATFWWLGVTTDTDPATGLAHPNWLGTVNAQLKLGGADGLSPVVESAYQDSPILFYDGNGTNAGSIDYVSGVYLHA